MSEDKNFRHRLSEIAKEMHLSGKDLLDDLYFGRIDIYENIPIDETAADEENILHEKIKAAVVEKYGNEKGVELLDEMTEAFACCSDYEMKCSFKEGLKFGFALHDLLSD